jgi:hypothetical protein
MTQIPSPPAQPLNVNAPEQLVLPNLRGAVYFNGFITSGGLTDATITLYNRNQAVATVQATYPVLKELAIALNEAVERNEKNLGITHPALHEVQ